MTVAIILLKTGAAITMISFGLYQYFLPQGWFGYIPEWMRKRSTLSPEAITRSHSIGNLALGVLLITGFAPLIVAWAAFIWWVSLLPFAFMYSWTVGVRDLTITISILALIFLLS